MSTVEIHSTLNWSCRQYEASRLRRSSIVEPAVHSSLNYPEFGSLNFELSVIVNRKPVAVIRPGFWTPHLDALALLYRYACANSGAAFVVSLVACVSHFVNGRDPSPETLKNYAHLTTFRVGQTDWPRWSILWILIFDANHNQDIEEALKMSFAEYLKSRNRQKVKHPVAFGFDAQAWQNAFQETFDGGPRDEMLRLFGLFLDRRLGNVRKVLRELEATTTHICSDSAVIDVIEFLNVGFINLQREGSGDFEGRESVSIEEISSSRFISSASGGKYTTEEALQSIVDAARHTLRDVMRKGKGYGNKDVKNTSIEPSASLRNAVYLAQFYEWFEHQWQRVLWNDAKFSENLSSGEYLVDQSGSPLAIEATLDLIRRNMKYQRDIQEASSIPLAPETQDESILYLNGKNEISVERLGNLPDDLREHVLDLAYQRHSITESNLVPLLKAKHGTILELSVHEVHRAWMQLSFLAVQQFMQVAVDAGKETGGRITVSIPISVLTVKLAEAVKVSEENAKKLIDYFTFDGQDFEQVLWYKPIVKIGNSLLLIWFPLLACHPMRLISHWVKVSKDLRILYDERGRSFESEVVTGLLAAIIHSKFPGRPFVMGPGLKMKDPTVGDVDALLVVGSTAFVLECRNVMHAATPHEFWSTVEELNVKIGKSVIKRDYLAKNPDILRGLIAKSPFSRLAREVNRVVAVVVSNSYIFEGIRGCDPYFIHIDTLFNIILSQGPIFGDILKGGMEVSYHVKHFKDGRSVDDSLISAISSPAKAEFYRKCLSKLSFPIPAVGQEEPLGCFTTREFSSPLSGTLKDVLDACSFASEIAVVQTEAVLRRSGS